MHLRNVAAGAAWFVRMSGGNKTEQQTAYIAGLLHDFIKPLDAGSGHAAASAAFAEKLLRQLKVAEPIRKHIVEAIADHPGAAKWRSAVHHSVFFADKVFEKMGAAVLFRGCTWVGQCPFVQKGTVLDSVTTEFVHFQKYRPALFQKAFRPLVKAQYEWLIRFVKALRTEQAWAMYLAAAGFRNGAFEKLPVHTFTKKFKPIAKEDAAARAEALAYMTGRKWNEWAALVRH